MTSSLELRLHLWLTDRREVQAVWIESMPMMMTWQHHLRGGGVAIYVNIYVIYVNMYRVHQRQHHLHVAWIDLVCTA